ncbi:MAG TPA: glycosyltransferase [Candidatus Sumerlaeota bacterium]|nr:glycosyltransferase [Candidatus Sumerlaeota bacterium]
MKVLFIGSCPLPAESGLPAQGPGIRTWQLVKPAMNAGHICLALCLRTEGVYPKDMEDEARREIQPGLTFINMSHKAFTNPDRIRALALDFKPDAIVGCASVLPGFTASLIRDLAPFWADCFGDPVTEIQAKAEMYGREGCGEELFGVWRYYRAILAGADRFSTLSDAQNHALAGQLALLGRLGYENAGYCLIRTIPCAVEGPPPIRESAPEFTLRGKAFPQDAFVVCFSGSYNTWMDVDLLFSGLEEAMNRVPRLVFLSTGGGTKGYNEKLYNDFLKKVEASPHRERFIMSGWVPFHEVPRYYAEANIGINVDRFTYEGVLGSRNRIIQFLAHGLPVMTTALSEISKSLAEKRMVHIFRMSGAEGETGVAETLPELLERLSAHPGALAETGRLAQKHVLAEYNYERTTRPLMEWLEAPERSPDNIFRAQVAPAPGEPVYLNPIEHAMDIEGMEGQIEYLLSEKRHLDKIRGTLAYRFLKLIKRMLFPS